MWQSVKLFVMSSRLKSKKERLVEHGYDLSTIGSHHEKERALQVLFVQDGPTSPLERGMFVQDGPTSPLERGMFVQDGPTSPLERGMFCLYRMDLLAP